MSGPKEKSLASYSLYWKDVEGERWREGRCQTLYGFVIIGEKLKKCANGLCLGGCGTLKVTVSLEELGHMKFYNPGLLSGNSEQRTTFLTKHLTNPWSALRRGPEGALLILNVFPAHSMEEKLHHFSMVN